MSEPYRPCCPRRGCIENNECSWPDPCLAEEQASERRHKDAQDEFVNEIEEAQEDIEDE